jgi:hypothetical protein
MQRRDFLISSAAAGAASFFGNPSAAHAGGKWVTITKEKGITVTNRREKNRQFPTFRGTGRVKHPILDTFAVISDADRQKEWMHKCADSAMLKTVDKMTRITYNRTDAPWPVKDRDCTLRAKVDVITPGKEIKIRFRAIKTRLKGEVADVVRMPVLEGHWYMVAMGPDKTLVEYQVNADPAGELPDWVVEQTSKDLPLHTIVNLRGQLNKTKGQYDQFIAKYR